MMQEGEKMERILAFFSKKTTGNILAIAVVGVFLILALVRLYPYENRFDIILNTTGDDWQTYLVYGMDIKYNGLLLPIVDHVYLAPAGFLYHYFVAVCLIVFGENLIPIFILQYVLAGLAVALMYWTFRDKMRPLTGIAFLGALALFTLMDFCKYYAVNLFSENLAFFLMPIFFFCFIRGFEKDNTKLQLLSAFLMGAIILARTNMLLVAAAMAVIASLHYIKKGKRGILPLTSFIVIMVSVASLLGLRNYLLFKEWQFLPTRGFMTEEVHVIPESVDLSKVDTNLLYSKLHVNKRVVNYVEFMRQEPGLFFNFYLKEMLFCFGFLSVLDPVYRWRPHWMLMWVGFFVYLLFWIKDRRTLKMWEVAILLYLFFYYGPLIAACQGIQNYGWRLFIPALNFVLIFAFLAWDRLSRRNNI